MDKIKGDDLGEHHLPKISKSNSIDKCYFKIIFFYEIK